MSLLFFLSFLEFRTSVSWPDLGVHCELQEEQETRRWTIRRMALVRSSWVWRCSTLALSCLAPSFLPVGVQTFTSLATAILSFVFYKSKLWDKIITSHGILVNQIICSAIYSNLVYDVSNRGSLWFWEVASPGHQRKEGGLVVRLVLSQELVLQSLWLQYFEISRILPQGHHQSLEFSVPSGKGWTFQDFVAKHSAQFVCSITSPPDISSPLDDSHHEVLNIMENPSPPSPPSPTPSVFY